MFIQLLGKCVFFSMCECVFFLSLPAQRPEPGQVVGVVHTVPDGDDFVEALDLNTEDLHRESLVTGEPTCVCVRACVWTCPTMLLSY